MVQRTVLKVDMSCLKCKKKVLKAVSGLKGNLIMSLLNLDPIGVDKVEADAAKGTLTVTGDCDPYEIIVRTRKVGKFVEVVSIGPPPAPPKPTEKKPEQKKPEEKKPDHIPRHIGMPYNYAIVPVYDEPNPSCCIM